MSPGFYFALIRNNFMNSKEQLSRNKRIPWIDGLKGMACLIVFFHHFFITFYSAMYYGTDAPSILKSGIDVVIGSRPIGVFLNGNFAVCMFIFISSFLAAYKGMLANERNVLEFSLKRYLRLMPAVAVIGIVYYIIVKVLQLTNNNPTNLTTSLTPFGLAKHIFIFQWIRYDSEIMGQFWCIYILFLGSIFAYVISEMSNENRWYMPFVYLILCIPAAYANAYYMPIMLGLAVSDIYVFNRFNQYREFLQKHRKKTSDVNRCNPAARYIIGTALILLGLYCGGYPSECPPVDGFYKLFSSIHMASALFHIAGSLFVFIGVMIMPKTRFLSSRFCRFLGKISFGIYVVHGAVINLISYVLTAKFESILGNYNYGVIVSFVITIVVVFAFAFLFNLIFERPMEKLISKIHLQ